MRKIQRHQVVDSTRIINIPAEYPIVHLALIRDTWYVFYEYTDQRFDHPRMAHYLVVIDSDEIPDGATHVASSTAGIVGGWLTLHIYRLAETDV